MSAGSGMDALLDAVRDTLRSALGLSAVECSVTPDGQPDPSSGQRFVAVHGGSIRNQQLNCLDELYSFRVTTTVRTGHSPRDRKRDGGAWALALRVRAALHMNYAVSAAAAAIDSAFVATVPPVFESAGPLVVKDASWFWAEPTGSSSDPTGIAIELSFARVRRIQYIEEQE